MNIKNIIVIIDDEIQIRKILSIALDSSNYKVIEAETGRDGLIQIATSHPQLIILDLGLPDKDGYTLIKEIRTWTNTPIIILSVRNTEEDIVKALDLGADDYLTKPFNTQELLARVRANLRRVQQTEEGALFINGNLQIDFSLRIVIKNKEEIKLTNTEFLLLSLLARNVGKVLTHRFILKEVWGSGYVESSQSLRVFISQLRKKIEDDFSNPRFIITESSVGYRMKNLN